MRGVVLTTLKVLGLMLIFFSITSCGDEPETTEQTSNGGFLMFEYGTTDEYHIQEIDGCEYILVNGMDNQQPALTHKGNCKYCMERNKPVLEPENKREEDY
jgi:hypothetical protein